MIISMQKSATFSPTTKNISIKELNSFQGLRELRKVQRFAETKLDPRIRQLMERKKKNREKKKNEDFQTPNRKEKG